MLVESFVLAPVATGMTKGGQFLFLVVCNDTAKKQKLSPRAENGAADGYGCKIYPTLSHIPISMELELSIIFVAVFPCCAAVSPLFLVLPVLTQKHAPVICQLPAVYPKRHHNLEVDV